MHNSSVITSHAGDRHIGTVADGGSKTVPENTRDQTKNNTYTGRQRVGVYIFVWSLVFSGTVLLQI